MENEYKGIKLKRCRGANQRMTIKSNMYAFKFLLSTVREDWNIFDFHSWFIQKVKDHNNSFIFCKRGKRTELLEAIEKDNNLKKCFQEFDAIVFLTSDQCPDISCYYDTSSAILTIPNKEWWEYHKLENEFKQLAEWFINSFKLI
jgi:hypothetical protein